MNTRADIEQMLNGYFARFPEDRTQKTAFTDFVAAFDGPALYNRKNFTGHITAGGIVVSRQSGRILLLKHKQLGKWLQPGGHVETGDATVSAAAIREIREETGIRQEQLEPLRFPNETSCLIEVDSHFIPRSDAKKRRPIRITTCVSPFCSTARTIRSGSIPTNRRVVAGSHSKSLHRYPNSARWLPESAN